MIATQERAEAQTTKPAAQCVEMKLEAVVIPVSDVDRAKQFYEKLGWRLDLDFEKDGFRGVQFTPPGSACSVHFGVGVSSAVPGSAQGLYLVVSDIETARDRLMTRGMEVSEVFHRALGEEPGSGLHPQRRSYASFATFRDPDGNTWLLQEVTARLPGRIDKRSTITMSSSELAAALRRAESAHGAHEQRTGRRHADWTPWYADYIVAEQTGESGTTRPPGS
jgi:catechol 2,3-dioxygenase-like lactoylglutathione lyase family enzyme